MDAIAVTLQQPRRLALATLTLPPLGPDDILIETRWSGVSSGTEKLLWTGAMPPFPGMGYPLVPGYESVGRIVDAGASARDRVGETVFVPGATCWQEAHSLFGGTASRLVTAAARAVALPESLDKSGVLLALAATAHHAIVGGAMPQLVVGNGALGRLIARIVVALGAAPPIVWEKNPDRRTGETVAAIDPDADSRRDYAVILDASGDPAILDRLTPRLARGGEIVLAGFYQAPLSFAFPPAFMREARIRIAAEFVSADLAAVLALIADGRLSLDGLVSHVRPAADAAAAYPIAFDDPACLKMVLDWEGTA